MAVVNYSLGADKDVTLRRVTWTPLTSTNVSGQPIDMGHWVDRCIQISGTFDGATCKIQGSNDGTNWFTLTDPLGSDISISTNAAMKQVTEGPLWMRPLVSGAGALTSLTVIAAMRGNR